MRRTRFESQFSSFLSRLGQRLCVGLGHPQAWDPDSQSRPARSSACSVSVPLTLPPLCSQVTWTKLIPHCEAFSGYARPGGLLEGFLRSWTQKAGRIWMGTENQERCSRPRSWPRQNVEEKSVLKALLGGELSKTASSTSVANFILCF